jgi:hydrogenase/urease accessory protein HupE
VIATVLLLGSSRGARAHPIAQGVLDVEISRERIGLTVRVTAEEVMIANAFGIHEDEDPGAAKPWERHGGYLLRHLQVLADGRRLAGRLLRAAEPEPSSAWAVYVFEYPLVGAPPPARVSIAQDVLRETEAAPGGRWEATYVVRIEQQGRSPVEGWLLTSREPLVFPCDWSGIAGPAATIDRQRMVREYLRHGVMHILAGWDHLLFITALVLAAVTLWDLVKVVSAFTLAHTITLTLSVTGLARLPERVVEPMIAASIVFVALQNVFWPRRTRGWSRLALAFFFGLFHGLGFAGGLLDAMHGMGGVAVGVAIAAFSAGVEAGHQMVVVPIFLALKLARATRADVAARERISAHALRYGSALISLAGVFYLIAALRQP